MVWCFNCCGAGAGGTGNPAVYRLFVHRLSADDGQTAGTAAGLKRDLESFVAGTHTLTEAIPVPMRNIICKLYAPPCTCVCGRVRACVCVRLRAFACPRDCVCVHVCGVWCVVYDAQTQDEREARLQLVARDLPLTP